MGFLSVLSGQNAKDWAQHGTKANIDSLYKGMREAQGYMRDGYSLADDALEIARNNARDETTYGYRTGKEFLQATHDEADRNLFQGFTTSGQFLTDGYRGANDKLDSALGRVAEIYNPYVDAGNAAQAKYQDIMGLNGAEAAEGAYDSYYDPSREFRNEQIMKAQNSAANAGGYLGSGRAGLATSRALNESQYGDMQNYQNRLERASQTGGQYAGQLAGLTSNIMGQQAQLGTRYGENLSNNATNLYNTLASADRQYGSALDTNSRNYFNNLAEIDLGLGSARSKNTIEHHKGLASLAQGTEATIGALHNKEAGQIAQANAAGANNIVGGITGVAKMFGGGGLFG